MSTTPVNIPNCLSGSRLAAVPILLVLAWQGRANAFLVLFVCALLTDLADGYLARRLHQESELGARLDSWGDFALYMATPICAWRLWPELIVREAPYVATVVASFTLPILVGLVRYRRLTSYHTWGAKLSAVLMGISTFILFAGGPAWPFRFSTAVLVLTQLEEISITVVLSEWHSNVPSLWHAMRLAGTGRKNSAA
ncbi:CDP-alcohol phosphatidyltransferase [bacterium]|nr:CDP-alcohol phosphatidyltransferase [bacterium]